MLKSIIIGSFAIYFSPLVASGANVNNAFENQKEQSTIYQLPGFFTQKTIHNDPHFISELYKNPSKIDFKKIAFVDNKGKHTTVGDFMHKSKTDGMIIIQGNDILYEIYSFPHGKSTLFPAYSITKALTSAALGVAIENQRISSVNDLMDTYAEKLKNSAYCGVTFKQALQMSSGIDIDKSIDTFNMIAYLNLPWNGIEDYILTKRKFNHYKPGEAYNYNDLDLGAIAMAIRESVGSSLTDYVQEKIWKPAGMEFSAKMQIDHQGKENGASGLSASLRDYARLGMIYANKGKLNNQQILPEKWINDTIKPAYYPKGKLNQTEVTTAGFGYSWWPALDKQGDFFSGGLFGQLVYVDPKSRIVIAKMGFDLADSKESTADSVLAFSRAIRDKITAEQGFIK